MTVRTLTWHHFCAFLFFVETYMDGWTKQLIIDLDLIMQRIKGIDIPIYRSNAVCKTFCRYSTSIPQQGVGLIFFILRKKHNCNKLGKMSLLLLNNSYNQTNYNLKYSICSELQIFQIKRCLFLRGSKYAQFYQTTLF